MEEHDPELAAALGADESYEACDSYQWCGQRIAWSREHNWLWLGISRKGNYVQEEVALVAMWVGLIQSIQDLKDAKAMWRSDPVGVFEQVDKFTAQYFDEAPEVKEAVEVYGQIQEDIEASFNELVPEGGTAAGRPKKSQAQPDSISTSTQPPGSLPMNAATSSPTQKPSRS